LEIYDPLSNTWSTASVAGADLIVENLSVQPAGASPGSEAVVSFTVRNQGSGGAAASSTNVRLTNLGTNPTSDDPLLLAVGIPSLAVGGSFSVAPSFVVPSNLASGLYSIWVIADVYNTAGQTNIANDKVSTAFSVMPLPPGITVTIQI